MLLNIFSLVETISFKFWETPISWRAKCSLPACVRDQKTSRAWAPLCKVKDTNEITVSVDKTGDKKKIDKHSQIFEIFILLNTLSRIVQIEFISLALPLILSEVARLIGETPNQTKSQQTKSNQI